MEDLRDLAYLGAELAAAGIVWTVDRVYDVLAWLGLVPPT